ncbi:DUF4912 domain-containing protein [Paenibacillus sp. 481]|uniref:DUF4912 domain-containing protein n=1 Tax=Paenibacillus sp. 481 TaxID=2835869 RepID=UPI001E2EC724|nr:DUF4912 domain-containing protein [Paenibacillus sp. 481]UHA72273.1 DUF4912 domain-containing protein [Paenibacillus sp. 481]
MFGSPTHNPWPPTYLHNIIHLMVKDPTTLFVYWEITERKRQAVERHYLTSWNSIPKIMRLYRSTSSVTQACTYAHSDIEVFDADSWYIKHIQANTAYMVDYGVWNSCQQFVPLLRSQAVQTPRNFPAGSNETSDQIAIQMTGHHVHLHDEQPFTAASYDETSPFKQFSTYTLYSTKEGVRS